VTKNIAHGYRESDERREFRASISGMLSRLWRNDVLREFPDSAESKLAELNSDIHRNLALGGILVDEEHGGLGATREFATVAAEELGAGLAPYDLIGACMTTQVLAAAQGPDRDAWLRRIADEPRPFVFAWPGANASWSVRDVSLASVTGHCVSGRVEYVPGLLAEALLVVPSSRGDELGVALLEGAAAADEVSLTEVPRADTLRAVSHLSIEGAECTFLPVPEPAFTKALILGAILLSAEMVGAARSCIERMVEYGLLRRQFGQPIVTFQALKHDVVDVAVDFERARASVYRAARRADATSVDGSDDDLGEAVMFARIAKASAGAALRSAAKQSIQLHGGTGFTWENLSHRYLKKWVTGNELFGSADAQRRLIYAQAQSDVRQ
jgi:alkylation response protein AidB-like acyl-CoA dehydrogenase